MVALLFELAASCMLWYISLWKQKVSRRLRMKVTKRNLPISGGLMCWPVGSDSKCDAPCRHIYIWLLHQLGCFQLLSKMPAKVRPIDHTIEILKLQSIRQGRRSTSGCCHQISGACAIENCTIFCALNRLKIYPSVLPSKLSTRWKLYVFSQRSMLCSNLRGWHVAWKVFKLTSSKWMHDDRSGRTSAVR